MLFSQRPISMKLLILALVACSSASFVSVTYTDSEYDLHDGVVEDWVAKASFTDTTFDDGFAYLEVETNPSYNDTIQAYAAGLAEGAVSYEMIYHHYRNILEGYCEQTSQEYCDKLRDFLTANREWLDSMISREDDSDPVMHNAGLVYAQLEGIAEGYNRTGEYSLNEDDFLMMNLGGDLGDLEEALDPTIRNMTAEEWVKAGNTPKPGSCSALIKVLPDNSDLYVSQVTWDHYGSMLRILKKYIFPFRRTGNSGPDDINPGHTVSFSGYPGLLFSSDDFHIMSSGLVSMETTIGNSNPQLWDQVSTDSIMEWMRTIIANRVASDGADWAHYFSMYNSGTYNNQWMIVDYNHFEPGTPIKPGTLWIIEQIPGIIESGDESDLLLLQTYWPSYNSPYYDNIFNLSGCPELVKEHGDWFSYDKTPRALIFQRDHSSIKDMDSMFKMMRYNDFQNDPLAICECDPPYSGENGISARSDLNPSNGTYPFSALEHRLHGGTDVKLTNYLLAKDYRFWAVNGPTYDQQPVFKWSEQEEEKDVPHYGHPDEWDFPIVNHEWVW